MMKASERKYFSQNGEDCILWDLFEAQTDAGYFVEVGALDGKRFSNTYSFELAGWKGICVEAHPAYMGILKRNRPGSHVVHAAVAERDGSTIAFYANSRGSLSTLNPDLETEFRGYGEYFTGWQIEHVPVRTLDSILEECNPDGSVDILSIDVEGVEMAVLSGFSIARYKPRVVITEAINDEIVQQISAYMRRAGYALARKLSNNLVFCRDRADVSVVATAAADCPLVHLPHPLDAGELSMEPSKAETLVRQMKTLMPQEVPFRELFSGFVLKEDTDFVISGIHFPLSQNCIHVLGKILRPRSYLEIGTRYGYSLGAIVHASPDLQRAVSVDIVNRQHLIRQNVASVRPVSNLELVCASSEIFDTDEQFDMVYVDGDHTYRMALQDMRKFWKNVRPGGVMVVDDTFNQRSDGTEYSEEQLGVLKAVKEFSATTPDMDSIVFQFPSYSGFCLMVKSAGAADVSQAIQAPRRSIEYVMANSPLESEAAPVQAIQSFVADPQNVFLVSFPRTGSHWLRMLMELYFDRPTLTRVFYRHERSDYLLLHDHDKTFDLQRRNAIYLFRDPVSTVFSQINYYRQDENDPARVRYWSRQYAQHLSKWLVEETFTHKKLVLRYEDLKADALGVLRRVCEFYGEAWDEARAAEAVAQVTKEHVRQKTVANDPQVLNVAPDYEKRRVSFTEDFSGLVWESLLREAPSLSARFEDLVPEEIKSEQAKGWPGRAKIVGLVPLKNERLNVAFCLRALSKFTDAIIVLDDCSQDETVEIVQSLAKECRVERILQKERWEYNETSYRQPLLDAGREIGGTHFIIIDADEAFTANLAEGDLLREEILRLEPGDSLVLPWIQLWRSTSQYRFDNSVWTNNYKAFIFADDGQCSYHQQDFHLGRVPTNLQGNPHVINGYQYGLMHFQFVNWRNLLVKQAWYRCLEHIRNPGKPVEAINALYAPSKDEANLGLRPAPAEWFAGYAFFNEQVFAPPEQWREAQVLEWFDQYGKEYFASLDIWDLDWGAGLAIAERPAGVQLPAGRDGSFRGYAPRGADQPLVTAIVSTYNSERFLRGCLEDLEAQTIADRLEIIVVDSCSPQNERAIVEEFQARYENIHYLRTGVRETVYAAWNRAIRLARGKYLTNANSDDRHRNDAFEVMVRTLEENPDVALAYADCLVTRTENETFESAHVTGKFAWYDFDRRLLFDACFVGPQPMWRREVHDEYGYFDPEFVSAGDYEFWLRISRTRKFLHVKETLGLYLESPHSVEHANSSRAREENLRARMRYRPSLDAPANTVGKEASPAGQPLPVLVFFHEEPVQNFWDGLIKYTSQPLEIHPVVGLNANGNAEAWLSSLPGQLPDAWRLASPQQDPLAAFNQALAMPGDGAMVFLSADVSLTPRWLERMYAHIGGEKRSALVAPLSNAAPQAQRVDPEYKSPGKPLLKFARRLERQNEGRAQEVEYTGAFCMLLDRGACRQVGSLDSAQEFPDALMAYFARLRQKGLKLLVAQDAYVHHQSLVIDEGAGYDELHAQQQIILDRLSAAQAEAEAGNWDKAVAGYARLAQDVPDLAIAHAGLAASLLAGGRPQAAVDAFRDAIALVRDDPALYNQLGVALYQNGEIEASEQAFLDAYDLDESNVDALLNLGDLYQAHADVELAAECIRKAVELAPADPQVLASFASVSLQVGDHEAAGIAHRHLCQIAPQHPAVSALAAVLNVEGE